MFYIKESEFDLNSKQVCRMLMRSCTVEEKVANMQEVRSANPLKDGNL